MTQELELLPELWQGAFAFHLAARTDDLLQKLPTLEKGLEPLRGQSIHRLCAALVADLHLVLLDRRACCTALTPFLLYDEETSVPKLSREHCRELQASSPGFASGFVLASLAHVLYRSHQYQDAELCAELARSKLIHARTQNPKDTAARIVYLENRFWSLRIQSHVARTPIDRSTSKRLDQVTELIDDLAHELEARNSDLEPHRLTLVLALSLESRGLMHWRRSGPCADAVADIHRAVTLISQVQDSVRRGYLLHSAAVVESSETHVSTFPFARLLARGSFRTLAAWNHVFALRAHLLEASCLIKGGELAKGILLLQDAVDWLCNGASDPFVISTTEHLRRVAQEFESGEGVRTPFKPFPAGPEQHVCCAEILLAIVWVWESLARKADGRSAQRFWEVAGEVAFHLAKEDGSSPIADIKSKGGRMLPVRLTVDAQCHVGLSHIMRGEHESGRQLVRATLQLAHSLGLPRVRITGLLALAESHLRTDEGTNAIQRLREARAEMSSVVATTFLNDWARDLESRVAASQGQLLVDLDQKWQKVLENVRLEHARYLITRYGTYRAAERATGDDKATLQRHLSPARRSRTSNVEKKPQRGPRSAGQKRSGPKS